MPGLLEGKVAVITGGASGMGRAAALRFLEEGARVLIADLNDGAAEEVVATAHAQGSREIRFIRADVSEERDVEAMIALAVKEFGRLDCVWNNVGWPGARGSLLEIAARDFDRTLAVNLRSVLLGMKHGGRVLKGQGQGGTLIATSSTSALTRTGPPIYATAKAAILHLVREFACELGPLGIRVNAIVPGAILTPMYRGDPEAWRPVLENSQPLRRLGEPVDIANMALFLASDQSRFITGAAMLVDGGQVADSGASFRAAMVDRPDGGS